MNDCMIVFGNQLAHIKDSAGGNVRDELNVLNGDYVHDEMCKYYD